MMLMITVLVLDRHRNQYYYDYLDHYLVPVPMLMRILVWAWA